MPSDTLHQLSITARTHFTCLSSTTCVTELTVSSPPWLFLESCDEGATTILQQLTALDGSLFRTSSLAPSAKAAGAMYVTGVCENALAVMAMKAGGEDGADPSVAEPGSNL